MRKVVTALALSLCVSQAAAEPPSEESIETLLKLTKVEALMASIYSNMEQSMRTSMRQALGNNPISDEQQQVLDKMPSRLTAIMKEEFTWALLKPDYIKLYQGTFEQKEVSDMISFYQTPSGRAVIDKMPQVMQQSMGIAQSRMKTVMPRIQGLVQEMMTEAKEAKK